MDLILVRGVSGAGKSTIGELFKCHGIHEGFYNKTLILSTDDMFVTGGFYRFDSSKLGEYHQATINKVEDAMTAMFVQSLETQHLMENAEDALEDGREKNKPMISVEKIVVCNTFTELWEMQPYIDLAEKYGWRLHRIIVENHHGSESIHCVPQDKIDEQRERFLVTI